MEGTLDVAVDHLALAVLGLKSGVPGGLDPLSDLLERPIPGDAPERIGVGRPVHGLGEALFVLHQLTQRSPLAAQSAAVDHVVGVALDVDHAPVAACLHVRGDGTAQ